MRKIRKKLSQYLVTNVGILLENETRYQYRRAYRLFLKSIS